MGLVPEHGHVVDNFNAGHDDVQVCWSNVGQGNDEYDKFQTAVTAGTGAPDVVMLEADRIPNYVVQKALVDIKGYGYDAVKDNFSAGAWKDVSVGDSIYAAPVDGGPMGLIYRTDVFEKYGISTPPTTWAEYEADARGQGRRWSSLRRPRRERASGHDGARDPEGRDAVQVRPHEARRHRDQVGRPGIQGRAELLGGACLEGL